jgi:hypothetical protein
MNITENLSWHAHICSLWHSLSKTFFIITSVQNTLSNHVIWNIYHAYFHSRLKPGIMLWGGTRENIKVLHIQKKVVRLIRGLNKYESCRQKFKENRILTVTSMYVLEVLCYIKKEKGDLQFNSEIQEYNTRSKHDLHTQPCNTSTLQNDCTNNCLWRLKNWISSTNLEKQWN